MDDSFYVRPEELRLLYPAPQAARRLSFGRHKGPPETWRKACRSKLAELVGFGQPSAREAQRLRAAEHEGVRVEAWVMDIDRHTSLPAYLLLPPKPLAPGRAVMAIHGHGNVEAIIGQADDYHHLFALRLAQAGHTVLCPALRGFGPLANMTAGDPDYCLDYWAWGRGPQFTLVTDGFLRGETLIGQTVEDLVRWEEWLARTHDIREVDVAGISYGGDLAITYPAFSQRVRRIYTSGSMGSIAPIFSRCYNAPAHCIPGTLLWMDRSDIAGLSAPRPIRLHYGELDTPGPENNSASYNETVQPALAELRVIYSAFGAGDRVSLHVTAGSGHEMDNADLLGFLGG
jgi:dienelactone hydrolase